MLIPSESPHTTPKEYLFALGIDLNKTTLLTVIDEYLRQVNLEQILNDYAELRIKEGANP
jgi:hypothetical protein